MNFYVYTATAAYFIPTATVFTTLEGANEWAAIQRKSGLRAWVEAREPRGLLPDGRDVTGLSI